MEKIGIEHIFPSLLEDTLKFIGKHKMKVFILDSDRKISQVCRLLVNEKQSHLKILYVAFHDHQYASLFGFHPIEFSGRIKWCNSNIAFRFNTPTNVLIDPLLDVLNNHVVENVSGNALIVLDKGHHLTYSQVPVLTNKIKSNNFQFATLFNTTEAWLNGFIRSHPSEFKEFVTVFTKII
jgi:hypothetical protein